MKRTPVVHPFFFAAFPVLALYAHNARSLPVPLSELAGPLSFTVIGSGILYAALRALLRNPAKAGFLASTGVLWILSFGHFGNVVSAWTGGMYLRSFFFATAILVGLFVWRIIRSRGDGQASTRVLNAIAVGLVLVNGVSVALTYLHKPGKVVAGDVSIVGKVSDKPNIYYLVFDSYPRADILAEVFGYDNSSFLSALRSRGFYVASESYANYSLTYHSLASSLNMTYLDDVAKDLGASSSNQQPLYRMILENRAATFLKSLGYKYLCFSSIVKPGEMKECDQFIGFDQRGSEFLSTLLDTTPVPLLFKSGSGRSAYDAHRRHILEAFQRLEESTQKPGPFFYFSHLMSPHPPFVFDGEGKPIEPGYPYSLRDGNYLHGGERHAVDEYISHYRGQLAFLNGKILETIDAILARSPRPPVIIIQGDHGSRALADLNRPEATYLKESLAILNAYLLPGEAPAPVSPKISPVNTFRLVFRRYFGADLELLDDRSAWCTWRHPFKFIAFDETRSDSTAESARALKRPKAPIVRSR